MNFRKRTQDEIDKSTEGGDLTGGYDFLPWILYMRPNIIFGFLLNLLGGILGLNIWMSEKNITGLGLSIVLLGIIVPLICFLIRRDFIEGKKGKSR